MKSDEEIRLMIVHWPVKFQAAVIRYAETGSVKRASSGLMSASALSKAINHGYEHNGELVFSTLDWQEVVSHLQMRAIRYRRPAHIDDIEGLFKQMFSAEKLEDMGPREKLELMKIMIDYELEIKRLWGQEPEPTETTRFLFEKRGREGLVPKEAREAMEARIREIFRASRDEKQITKTGDDDIDGGNGEAEVDHTA